MRKTYCPIRLMNLTVAYKMNIDSAKFNNLKYCQNTNSLQYSLNPSINGKNPNKLFGKSSITTKNLHTKDETKQTQEPKNKQIQIPPTHIHISCVCLCLAKISNFQFDIITI